MLDLLRTDCRYAARPPRRHCEDVAQALDIAAVPWLDVA
jgi:hypothetical protein